jgi:hypothetical protein
MKNIEFGALLRLRCAICGIGKLFRGYFDNPIRCVNCGYFFMRESGYFLAERPPTAEDFEERGRSWNPHCYR